MPRAKFEWKCLDSGTQGTTEFVLDSGSQLNLLPMSEIRDQGIDMNSLPRIDLDVIGIGGSMKATWLKFRVNMRSKLTGQSNFEEVYLAEECTDKLLSYETLKHLGHIDEDTFLKKSRQIKDNKDRGRLLVHAHISKCEESTVFDMDKLEYQCNCPRRSSEMNDK